MLTIVCLALLGVLLLAWLIGQALALGPAPADPEWPRYLRPWCNCTPETGCRDNGQSCFVKPNELED